MFYGNNSSCRTYPSANREWESRLGFFFRLLYQLPVPFFFAVSGFFLWNKVVGSGIEQKLTRIWKWLRHVLLLYVLWTILYLPYTIYGFKIEQTGIVTSLAIFFRNFLFVGENYYSYPLWYLHGMCVAGTIVYVFTKTGLGIKSMMAFALALVCFGFYLDQCHDNGGNAIVNLYYTMFLSTRNGFFRGFPYMMVGILIAEKTVSKKMLLIGLAMSAVFWINYLTGMLLMYFGVQSLLRLPIVPQRFPATIPYRIMCNVTYFTHMIWVGCFVLFFNMDNAIFVFFSTLCMCLLTSLVVIRNAESKWVRLLFR